MKRLILTLLLLLATLGATTLKTQAQESSALPLKWGASVSVGTPGVSVEGALNFFPGLTARVGLNYIGFTVPVTRRASSFGVDTQESLGYDPEVHFKARFSTFTGHLLLDYEPIPLFSTFHITGGFYIGANALPVNIALINPNTGKSVAEEYKEDQMPSVTVEPEGGEKLTITPNQKGEIDIAGRLGNAVKPYLGVGFGSSIPKMPVGVRFDLGMIYSGALNFSSPEIDGDVNKALKLFPVGRTLYSLGQWYPVASVGLTIRLSY